MAYYDQICPACGSLLCPHCGQCPSGEGHAEDCTRPAEDESAAPIWSPDRVGADRVKREAHILEQLYREEPDDWDAAPFPPAGQYAPLDVTQWAEVVRAVEQMIEPGAYFMIWAIPPKLFETRSISGRCNCGLPFCPECDPRP